MMKLLIGSAATAAVLLTSACSLPPDDLAMKRDEMLNPTVRVTASMKDGTARGSGTLLHSGDDGVFILTNDHVVRGTIEEHPEGQAEVTVEDWVFLPGRDRAMPITLHATVVSDDQADDMALLRVTDPDFRADAVADVITPADRVEMGEPVFAVGGGIGNRPFITQGLISIASMTDGGSGIFGRILVSSPIVGGNSGGGAYVLRNHHYTFVGMPSAVLVAGNAGVPHMGLVIPLSTIRPFLVKAGLGEFRTAPAVPHRARAMMATG